MTFVSSARGFDGEGLTALFAAAELAAGMEVFAATDAGLTIWHSANESESYTLEGDERGFVHGGGGRSGAGERRVVGVAGGDFAIRIEIGVEGRRDGVGAIVDVGIEAAVAGIG